MKKVEDYISESLVDEEVLKARFLRQDFHLSKDGFLSKYGWGKDIFFPGMNVLVKKPDNINWRKGEIDSIRLVNEEAVITVVCGKNRIKFEKSFFEIKPDNRIKDIFEWDTIEVPERLKKMDTFKLLKEFRKRKNGHRRSRLSNDEQMVYKKELYLREHVGQTNAVIQKEIRRKKAKMKW